MLGWLADTSLTPETAVKPFDRTATGVVPGEAAAVLAIETIDHAERRGATPKADILGFGAACIPSNHGASIAAACEKALAEANVKADDLGFVVGSGVGVPEEDGSELIGVHSVLGASKAPLLGLKGYLGYTGAGSGVVEIVAALLAAQHGALPATLNFSQGLPHAERVTTEMSSIDSSKPFACYSMSHSGHCGAIVLRLCD